MLNKISNQLLPTESTLYLLRHGEIDTPGILAGKTDVALSALGRNQLLLATSSLKSIDRCISSPLVRCCQYANLFCQQQNLSLEIENKLQEMDFGDWDGRTYQSLWKIDDRSTTSAIGDFWQNPWQNQPPNGESMTSFTGRIDHWWKSFCDENESKNTLVFTHAGVIKHLLARVLNLPIPGTSHMDSIEVPYACLIKISLYRDESGKVWSKLVL
ncbi:histidine phosphatase family protein [Colwellia sp. 20A7]|uniref:histidine phosphatase family protein n=1 Tax=Colwellia sp. 20A7 TaxID=2689569 RepID=UPI00135BB0C1|nr:histidine phosphatase family protein [Colwellia sp. 20A7]